MSADAEGKATPTFDFGPWLDPDETLVWQGAPAPKLERSWLWILVANGYVFGWAFALAVAYALVSFGIDLIEKATDWRSHRIGFGLASLVAAIFPVYAAIGMSRSELSRVRRDAYERYALTQKRALAAYFSDGQYLVKSVPISETDWIGSSFGPKGRIVFSRQSMTLSDGGELLPDEDLVEFKDIPDADQVYRLIRSIQNRAST